MISHLEEALTKRRGLLEELRAQKTQVYRLFGNEGISGVVIDVFGDVAILQVLDGQSDLPSTDLKKMAQWCLANAGVKSVYLKNLKADRSTQIASETMYSNEPFAGEKAPEVFTVLESGLRYRIRPYAGFQPGLFVDQRDNRRELAGKGSTVLNLFAYTCAFSVACAAKGAKVTSVDLSKKYLEWGRENFSENQIPFEGQRFICEDAFSFCAKEQRRGKKYDLIVLDPPSFSRDDRGKVFSLAKDLERLAAAVTPLIAPGGRLFFSCNLSSLNAEQMTGVFDTHVAVEAMPELPLDFSLGGHALSYVLIKP